MPVYEYKGVTSRGKKISGVQDGEGLKAVRAKLKKDGMLFGGIELAYPEVIGWRRKASFTRPPTTS